MTLYELTTSAIELYELLQSGEVDEQTVIDTLEGMGIDEKLEDCCKVLRQLEGDVVALKMEEVNLQAKRMRAEKGIQRIKSNLLGYMISTGKDKQKAGVFNLSTRNSKAINITDSSLLPDSVFEIHQPTVSKSKIHKLFEQGEIVAGAEIVTNKSIQIK